MLQLWAEPDNLLSEIDFTSKMSLLLVTVYQDQCKQPRPAPAHDFPFGRSAVPSSISNDHVPA